MVKLLRAFVHSAAHRNPMPIRLLPLIAALWVLLLIPAGALAADYVPGQVIVKYARGRGRRGRGERGRRRGRRAGRRPARRLRAAEDRGRRVRARHDRRAPPGPERGLRGAELEGARRGQSRRTTPDWRLQWNLSRPVRDQPGRRLDRGGGARRARAAAARSSRCSTAAWRTSGYGRYRRAPDLRRSTFIHPWDFIQRDRHPNDVYGHGTHVAGTIAQTTNNGIGTAGHRLQREDHAAAGARLARRGRLGRDRARHPLRGPPPRRRDQPVARVPGRGALRRDPRRGQRAPLRAPARRRRRGGGRQPDRHHRGVSRAREDA